MATIMKELSIEEKAKHYDEAIINGLRLWECGLITRETYENIFPELKESEDERIIHWIKKELEAKYVIDNIVNNVMADKALAWLEKQDAKISVYSNTLFKIATILSQYEDKDDSPLEKIRSIMIDGTICSMDLESKKKESDEQKPTDEEMKILLQTEYEKGKADAIEAAMESVTKDKESAIKFLKSAGIINNNGTLAKEYVADNVEQRSAWSEEDIRAIDRACVALRAYSNGELPNFLPSELLGYADKLQSLISQNRWKPSDEQMEALYNLMKYAVSLSAWGELENKIESLYKDLKKLRGE